MDLNFYELRCSLFLFSFSFSSFFFGLASELSSFHELVDELNLFGGSLLQVLFPGSINFSLTVLSSFLLHAELFRLGLKLKVSGVEIFVFFQHLFALSPLSETILLENFVISQEESLNLTNL